MKIDDAIKDAFHDLISDGTFFIEQLDYNSTNFGNRLVVLKSNYQVDIRFISDRGTFWCEVGQMNEWYFIEDVFAMIEEALEIESSDFIDFIKKISVLIKKYLPQIFLMFNSNNVTETKIKIKEISQKRVMGVYGTMELQKSNNRR